MSKLRNRLPIRVLSALMILLLVVSCARIDAIADPNTDQKSNENSVLELEQEVTDQKEPPEALFETEDDDNLIDQVETSSLLDEENVPIALTGEDEISVFAAEITVYDEAGFRAALANAQYTTIFFGANITMISSTSATVASRPLVINGTDPSTGITYTYTDYSSYDSAYVSLQGPCLDITFQDMNVWLYNWYGIYRANVAAQTVTFDNVTGSSPQFYHYYTTSSTTNAGGTFIIKDSDLVIENTGRTSDVGELAEADRVIFQGDVTITKREPSDGDSLFWLIGSSASITVENGAHVVLDNTYATNATSNLFYGISAIDIADNATFAAYTQQGFTGSGSAAVSIGSHSDVKLIYTATSNRAVYGFQASRITAGTQSNFLLYDRSTSGALVAPTLTLNSPNSFVVLNGGSSRAITSAVALSANQIQDIQYFSSSQISSVYDATTHSFIGDGSVFSNWWIQVNPFTVTASAWQGSSPTVSTTPAYTAASIPPAAQGSAETTLASNNFGLTTTSAYGFAIQGKANADINIQYYFDGIHDGSYDTALSVPMESTVTQADVELAPVPLGYKLAGVPTDPILPESAEVLDGSTVNVYYVTDPDQTASVAVNYYFDGTHDGSHDTTIMPQILSTVNESDVVLATAPPGYMLDTPATSPTLPASAQSLDGTTVNVYYVTDPAQTASIDIQYYFDGTHNAAYDQTITPQLLSSVGIYDVILASPPIGYTLSTPSTSVSLPASAQSLNGTTVIVYYVTDPSQVATINIQYYFNGVHDVSYDAIITPQVLAIVSLASVVLGVTPPGYMLDTPATSPLLPQGALSLDGTTISVYYVLKSEHPTSESESDLFSEVGLIGSKTGDTIAHVLAIVLFMTVSLGALFLAWKRRARK